MRSWGRRPPPNKRRAHLLGRFSPYTAGLSANSSRAGACASKLLAISTDFQTGSRACAGGCVSELGDAPTAINQKQLLDRKSPIQVRISLPPAASQANLELILARLFAGARSRPVPRIRDRGKG